MGLFIPSLFKFIAYIPSDDPDLGDDIVHTVKRVERALSGVIASELVLKTRS